MIYPTLSMGFEAKSYKEAKEDPSEQTKMEGGIVVTRRKFTRKPRKTFTFQYSELPDADKIALENFYDSVGGGCDIFTFANPSGQNFDVRFSKPLDFQFMGVGASYYMRWQVQVELQEV